MENGELKEEEKMKFKQIYIRKALIDCKKMDVLMIIMNYLMI